MPLEVTHHRMTANGLDQHMSSPAKARRWCCCTGSQNLVRLGHQIPALAEHYTVIAPDLRGYGYTEKPHTGYDKRTMAADIRELMTAPGL